MNKLLTALLMGAVAIILLACVYVPIANDAVNNTATMYYDDYIEIPSGCTCEGNAEIVNIAGKEYIHANDVGNAKISKNDVSIDITISKAELDIYLITGQSNSGNYVYDLHAANIPPLGSCYYYGYENEGLCYPGFVYHASECDMHPVTSINDNELVVADKCPNFCATYYEKTGHKIYWLNGGIGGVEVSTFNPNGSDPVLYNYNYTILADAIKKVDLTKYNVNVQDFIWIQGESDATTPVSNYKTDFMAFYNALTSNGFFSDIANWPNQHFNKCWISLMPSTYANSRAAQIELIAENQNILLGSDAANGFTIENELMSLDGWHYSQKGDNIIAEDLVKKCISNVSTPIKTSELNLTEVPGGSLITYAIPAIVLISILVFFASIAIRRSD